MMTLSVTALVNYVIGGLLVLRLWQGANHHQDSDAIRPPFIGRGRPPFVVVERGHHPPAVVAHRGSSGTYPESSMKAFEDAVLRGVAFLEGDVQMTKDGKLVVSHDPNLVYTTNVADFAEFHGRKKSHVIDGKNETGWFTLDFTLDELRKLRIQQRYTFRDHSYDNTMAMVTVDELMAFVVSFNQHALSKGLTAVGVLLETKHPFWYLTQHYDITNTLLNSLEPYATNVTIFIESFERWNLIQLKRRMMLPLQLTALTADIPQTRRQTTTLPYYGSMYDLINGTLTPIDVSLTDIAEFANAIGPEKTLLLNQADRQPTNLVEEAHLLGLLVQPWTFNVESCFVCPAFEGSFEEEIRFFGRKAGADAIMTDFPDETVKALDALWNAEL